MIVGSLGSLVFRTSSFDVQTFKNLQRKRAYTFQEQQTMNNKPYLQRVGEALETISFDMVFDNALNPAPKDCTECRDLLVTMQQSGNAFAFVVGTRFLGFFVIESLEEKDKVIVGNAIVRMDLAVSLKEYN